jgi:PAS domain S-box-containing protein
MHRPNDEEAARLRSFIELLPVCSLVIDSQGVIRRANAEAARTFGWPLDELVGRDVERLVPEPLRDAHAKHRRGFQESARVRTMGETSRVTGRRRDGTLFPIDVMLTPIGTAGDVLAAVIDQSDLGRAEEALSQSATVLRQVTEGVQDVVYVVRLERDALNGRVEMVSAHVKNVVGYEAREFIADPSLWLRSIHPDDVATLAETTQRMIESKEPVLRSYRMRHCVTGQWRILEDRAAPLLDEQGRVVATCGAARDVTEHREHQADLMMTERLAAIGMLAASVAHELNNPLTSIQLGLTYVLELLSKEPSATDRAIEALGESLEGAVRMGEILRDLTGLARRESTPKRVDPRRAADVAVRLAAATIRECADLVRSYEPVPEVRADETRLAQVLLNLLVNAAQAIPDGRRGTITLSTRTESDGRATLSVRDDGAGISAEHLSRVFEPFFTTKPQGSGTGLGLYVSKRIIEELGGEIAVESEPGGGTEVKVWIPAAG